MTEELRKIFNDNYEGLSASDKEYLFGKIDQILRARYYGGAVFPIDHPDYKDNTFKAFNAALCGKLFGGDVGDIIEIMDNSQPVIRI